MQAHSAARPGSRLPIRKRTSHITVDRRRWRARRAEGLTSGSERSTRTASASASRRIGSRVVSPTASYAGYRPGGRPDPQVLSHRHGACGHRRSRDRAHRVTRVASTSTRAPRHRHRPPWRRGRPHPRSSREARRASRSAQHPRGQEPRVEAQLVAQGVPSSSSSRVVLPSRHAKAMQSRMKSRRQGHPSPGLRSSRWRRDVPHGVLPRGPRPAAHAARTSTTASMRLAPPSVASA